MALLSRGRRGRRRMKRRAFWMLAGAVCAIGMLRLWGPLGAIREQSGRMAQLRGMKASLLSQQASLEEEGRFLATEAGREAAARRIGYVRPGERRLVFVPAASGETKRSGARQERPTGDKR